MVAKVEWHQGELSPRVGFIVTNMWLGPRGDGVTVDKGRQVKLIRFGARLLLHARRLVFQLAEVAVPPAPF